MSVERFAPCGAIFLSYAREDFRLRQAYGGQGRVRQAFRRRQAYGGQVGGRAAAMPFDND